MTNPSVYKKYLLVFLAILIAVSAFPLIVIYQTPEGCIPREWVLNFRQIMFAICGVCLFIGLIILTCVPWKIIHFTWMRALLKILVWGLAIPIFYTLFFIFVFSFPWDVELKDYGDTLLVEHNVWLDSSTYSIYKKEGIFYMRWECWAGKAPPSFEVQDNSQNTPAVPTPQPTPDSQPEDQFENEEFALIFTGEHAVYQNLPESLKGSSDTTSSYPKESYTSKGDPELIVSEDESSITYIRYDRFSDNQKCLLYVLYRSEKNSDGSYDFLNTNILDMYAYSIDDGRVVASGRTAWSDIGTQEYQDITG